MRRLRPMQRERDEMWEMTAKRKELILPIGYCAANKRNGEPCMHDTEQDARDCYKRYLIERMTIETDFAEPHYCVVKSCDVTTKSGFLVGGYRSFALCDEHRLKETLFELVVVGANSWES